ncbi:alpha/beta hydrolase family protein [Nocardia fluminea]|uniref:alpha/beta hydrolase family protein n=1 Tax=Nocardia fluminea TaxID=134984 RepID=UPI00366467E2
MRPLRRVLVTACALTGTTNAVARFTGVRWLLPDVLVTRFAGLIGVDATSLGARLAAIRSFEDSRWTGYWNAIADERLATAHRYLALPAAAIGLQLPPLESLFAPKGAEVIGTLLGPAADYLGDRGYGLTPVASDRRAGFDGTDPVVDARLAAIDALIEAIFYRTVAAWPGATTPSRSMAYIASRQLVDVLLAGLGPHLDVDIAQVGIRVGIETVQAVTIFPRGTQRCPVVLATNGLDGTVQELVLSLLKYRRRGLGMVIMEMPGSNLARQSMSRDSAAIYQAVIDELSVHPRVDAGRLAMFGLSFGGYWAAHTAAVDARVRCAVCVGAPTHRGFGPGAAIGVAQPMIRALRTALGAHGFLDMGRKLASLSLRRLYARIAVPLLVIDGEFDTVVDVRDSRELAAAVANSTLRLYPGDDHCAPMHYTEWLDEAMNWLIDELAAPDPR